jgi:hypothetical protein
MKQIVLSLLAFSLALPAHAKIDFSKYDLTPEQRALYERLEAKGVDEAAIVKLLEKLSSHNGDSETYIPAHTTALLLAINTWAAGAAYAAFAKEAGQRFDMEAYQADCPNREVFNFGFATGQRYFNVDVTTAYINTFYALNMIHYHSPETFARRYLEMIQESPFAKYLLPESEI